ncbi:uncharacterized protein LOC129003249 [Macrosteles quadrilineatus]|uniref:uncharacterized protein LOC129003249 n=1 Tax=Macrosteles quadrilineatus TaxID=74068 RepID=UPI0023E217CA|nr:uncharacterized protein LOC129003249 [Macrosteles quadrilineatus]
MTATEYARYANDDRLKWECGRNDCMRPEAQPQNLLLNQLTILTSKITELAGKVDSLSALPSKLDNITAKLDELNSNFASLENRIGNNEIKIKTIEDRLENISVTPATNPELIIAESNERAYRARNIMIYELPECDSRDVSVRKKHDVDLAVELFSGVRPDVVLDVRAAVRVGKKTPNKPRPLKIVLDNETNARGFSLGVSPLRLQLNLAICFLLLNVAASCYDILAFVETNLTPDIKDTELGLDGFNIFRCDRNELSSCKSSGGVSLIAVRNTIQSRNWSPTTCTSESVFVVCNLLSSVVLFGCTYIPPSQRLSAYSSYCDAVDEVLITANVDNTILMGDFNLPNVEWSDFDPTIALDDSSRLVSDLALTHGLTQINGVRNSRGVCLDLIFSSFQESIVTAADDILLAEDRHHPALTVMLPINKKPLFPEPKYVLNFRRCNLDAIFHQLQDLTIPQASDLHNINDVFSSFCENLKLLIEANTPLKMIRNSNFPKWFSSDLKRLIIEKKMAHKSFKASGDHVDFVNFTRLRTRCKEMTRVCYDAYIANIEETIPSNIKSFWSHIENLSADFPVPAFDFGLNDTVSHCSISATVVEEKLNALDHNKSAGPDNIPPLVLKFCAPVLAPHLAVLFNALIKEGIFPSFLKLSYVVPIFKSGSRCNAKNYRPIVIQPTIAKVFESIVLEHLYFNLKKYIAPEQHGFLDGKSTITNLLCFQEFVMSAFGRSSQVDCVYLDFSKAFDRVQHRLLVAKLAAYGVGGSLLRWVESYLKERYLIVKCEGATSKPFPVISGVPQGSHIGPLLFDLFINDIGTVLTTNYLMFADDIKIFSEIHSVSDQENLQRSIGNVVGWCKNNSMDLNVSKCQVMTFKRGLNILKSEYYINGSTLPSMDKVKDLGIFLTPSLSPFDHIVHITSRAHALLGFVFRSTRNIQDPRSLVLLYKTLVRPILEYGSVIWSPHQLGHIDLLSRIQARFIRMLGIRIGYAYTDVPIEELQRIFGIQPLHIRRRLADLVVLYKLVNGLLDSPDLLFNIDLIVPRGTRSRAIFQRRFHPTSYAYNSGLSRLLREGAVAAAHVDFFSTSAPVFKRCASAFLT